jgi:vacuolar-type H+-ATPase subunit C/Vma6
MKEMHDSMPPTFEWEKEWEETNQWETAKSKLRNLQDYRQKKIMVTDPLGVALYLQSIYVPFTPIKTLK